MQHDTPAALVMLMLAVIDFPHTLRQQLAPLAVASELLSVFRLENKSHENHPRFFGGAGAGVTTPVSAGQVAWGLALVNFAQ